MTEDGLTSFLPLSLSVSRRGNEMSSGRGPCLRALLLLLLDLMQAAAAAALVLDDDVSNLCGPCVRSPASAILR